MNRYEAAMTPETVETAARSICKARGMDPDGISNGRKNWEAMRMQAIEALNALPTLAPVKKNTKDD